MALSPIRPHVVTAWWIIIAVGFTVQLTCAMQVTLLDTTQVETLGWATYTPNELDIPKRGWREASYTSTNGDLYRVYMVCNVAVTSVDNWLRTPYIPRGQANRLYVDVKFTMRRCTKYPDPVRLQQCKESFKLLYYEAESDFANSMRPSWDVDAYRHVDVVAADRVFSDINNPVVNSETRSIAVTSRGVYFAFFDQGACTTLLSVRIYYIACPSIIANYAVFPDTPAGPEMTSIVQQDGICLSHSTVEHPPSYLCKADGNWYYATGRCQCVAGYQPDAAGSQCIACLAGTYKWKRGSEVCLRCPQNSNAEQVGADECQCDAGFYRGLGDDKSLPCTRPPSSVADLKVTFHDQSSVGLEWNLPEDSGGRADVRYRVDCVGCDGNVVYTPRQSNFAETQVMMSGLKPSTNYRFQVYAENGVSLLSGVDSVANIDVTTDIAVPPKVLNVRVVNIATHSVSLIWDVVRDPHFDVDIYDVSYFAEGSTSENVSTVFTKQPNITLDGLLPQTKYVFRVRVRTTSNSWGEYSDTVYATTGLMSQHLLSSSPVGIIAGSAVAVVLCMLIVIIMVIIFLRRNQRTCNEKHSADCDLLHYNTVHCPNPLDGSRIINGTMTVPLYFPAGSVRTYIDPYTYEDPNQAVREFAKEIDTSLITIESVIGGGEFGDVCKGKLKRHSGSEPLNVAIKTLKVGASDKNRLDFLTEASIMGQFDDPNVIYLEGVVTRSNPIMIVTEFMENGSLDSFLRTNDGKFTIIQLVGMLRGIASGMRYLSDMGYVHRDLAARNILVSETLVCKVADFGLSREIESDSMDGEYTTKGGKIPVRWTAPEAIAYRKFTSASDVWSYGVVTWEVISYGERPYWNWPNQDVISAVNRGFTLPPPMDCPEAIYELMLECWNRERARRPKFCAVVKSLDKLIRAPELLKPIAKPRPQCSQLVTPTVTEDVCSSRDDVTTLFTSVSDWLIAIKMDRYIESFTVAGITSLDDVARLSLKDLVGLGVTLVGHQKKIMNSIQALNAQRRRSLTPTSVDSAMDQALTAADGSRLV